MVTLSLTKVSTVCLAKNYRQTSTDWMYRDRRQPVENLLAAAEAAQRPSGMNVWFPADVAPSELALAFMAKSITAETYRERDECLMHDLRALAHTTSSSTPATPPEILLVDDDAAARRLMSISLESTGFSVRTAASENCVRKRCTFPTPQPAPVKVNRDCSAA